MQSVVIFVSFIISERVVVLFFFFSLLFLIHQNSAKNSKFQGSYSRFPGNFALPVFNLLLGIGASIGTSAQNAIMAQAC